MSRLPEKGDAARAMDAWNARAEAAAGVCDGNDHVNLGEVTVREAGVTGDGAAQTLAIFGDLFNVSETMLHGGGDLVLETVRAISAGGGPVSETASLFMTGVALGVLMERHRWEGGS